MGAPGDNAAPNLVSTDVISRTFLGRCLLWRAPTGRDHLRLPFHTVVAAGTPTAPLPRGEAHPAAAIDVAALGPWSGGTLQQLLAGTATRSFLAVRRGEVVCEWHAPGVDPAQPARNQSVTKSIASLLLAQLVGSGAVRSLDGRIGELVPGLQDDGVAALTLAQLTRMSAGIGYREGAVPWSDDARVYHGTRLRMATLRRRLADPVDGFFHYNDWHPLLLALAIERASGTSVADALARQLWQPLQGGAATLSVDREGAEALPHLESGFNCTAEGLARVGQLVLQRGLWEGRQLVPEAAFARLDALRSAWRTPEDFRYYADRPWGRALMSGRYAYMDFWWHHLPEPGVHDLFAMGALGAHVYVARDMQTVLVRQADRFPPGLWWPPLLRRLAEGLAR